MKGRDSLNGSVGGIIEGFKVEGVEEVVSNHGFLKGGKRNREGSASTKTQPRSFERKREPTDLQSPLASSRSDQRAVVDDDSADLSGSRSGGFRGDGEGLSGRRRGSLGRGSSEGGRRRSSVTASSLPVGGSSESEGREEEEERRKRDWGDHVEEGSRRRGVSEV